LAISPERSLEQLDVAEPDRAGAFDQRVPLGVAVEIARIGPHIVGRQVDDAADIDLGHGLSSPRAIGADGAI